MTLYNWFEARNFALAQGYAIRFEPAQSWLVYRAAKWWTYTLDPTSGRWSAHVVLNSEFAASDFQRKDFVLEAWEGGSLPPCTNPAPAEGIAPNVTGGAASWGGSSACVPPMEDTGTGEAPAPASPPPPNDLTIVLKALDVVADRPGGAAYDFTDRCWLNFALGTVGGYRVFRRWPVAEAPRNGLAWLARNADFGTWSVSGTVMIDPGLIGHISAPRYTGVLGPFTLVADTDDAPESTVAAAMIDGALVPYYDGPPTIAQEPGDTFYALFLTDYDSAGSSHHSYQGVRTIAGWCAAPAVSIAVTTTVAADQDGTRHYWGPGPDGILGDHSVDPSTDPDAADDTHDVVACWVTAPATETIHVSATATGGKPGVAGTTTLTINGVDQMPVAGRTATWDGTLPYSDAATYAGLARYDQPADATGPAVTHTQAFTITLSPLCASLPASDMFA